MIQDFVHSFSLCSSVHNGQAQRFVYDLKGQLTAVLDEQNKPVEAYRYDAAGNILEKTLDGQTTRYVYDKANQLVSSTVDGQETLYRYDAAGRLVQEGNKTYAYGYQDKILSVKENGKVAATFDYYLNGQLASVTRGSETETFYWDGLALVARGQTRYLNEPHAGGGAPVLASGKTLFNDLLGNTLGVQEGETYTPVKMTAFGETKTKEAFFTGKPFIGELGYAFLLRNYRPNHGKWQTADPLGYPDGWNNFAYCNNWATDSIDWLGGGTFSFTYDTLWHPWGTSEGGWPIPKLGVSTPPEGLWDAIVSYLASTFTDKALTPSNNDALTDLIHKTPELATLDLTNPDPPVNDARVEQEMTARGIVWDTYSYTVSFSSIKYNITQSPGTTWLGYLNFAELSWKVNVVYE